MMASLMALNALAIDAMLPAFPAIVGNLSLANPNSIQYIISIFLVGTGVGALKTELEDAYRAKQEGLDINAMETKRNSVIPLRRANDPQDIAAMVVFLASPGARNISGQSINVDGGVVPD